VFLAVAAFAAACGTTVQGASSSDSGGGLSLGGPSSTVAPTAGPLASQQAVAYGPGSVAGQQPGTTGGGSTGYVTPSDLPDVGTFGLPPGVTAKEVRIGALTESQNAAAAAAAGVNVKPPDTSGSPPALDDINAHGGIAGRKVVIDYYNVDTTSSTPQSVQFQAACAHWTEDTKVIAVVVGIFDDPGLVNCLSRRHVITVGVGITQFDAQGFRDLLLFNPATIDLSRLANTWVDALARRGYFKTGTFGLLRQESTAFDRVTREVLKPALARHGVKLATEVSIAPADTPSDLSRQSSEAASATLTMSANRVDKVLIWEYGGNLTLFFTKAAESQQYRPKYALTGNTALATLAGLPGGSTQFAGSVAIGWLPFYNVNASENPPTWAGRERCRKAFQKAGKTWASNISDEGPAVQQCDELWFLHDAAAASGGLPSTANLVKGANLLGSSFATAATFTSLITPTKHAGAGTYRDMDFDTVCSCYHFTAPVRPVED